MPGSRKPAPAVPGGENQISTFKVLLALARLSVSEALHKKIWLAALGLTAAYLAIFGAGMHFVMQTGSGFDRLGLTQLFNMGLFLAALLATLLAALLAVGSISGELESGTTLALVSKPVGRGSLVLGKFLGYAAMLAAYAVLLFLALWGLASWQGGMVLTGIAAPLGLFVLQPLVMLAVTLLASAATSTLGAGIIAFMLYGVALIGGMVEQVGALLAETGSQGAPAMINMGIVSSLLLPADVLYRRASYLLLASSGDLWHGLGSMVPFGVASVPSRWMVLYAGVYLVVCLLVAMRVFARKDIG